MTDRCWKHRITGGTGADCPRCGFHRAIIRARCDWIALPAPTGSDTDPLARVRSALARPAPEPAQPALALMILRMGRIALLLAAAGFAAGIYYYNDTTRGELMQLSAADPGSVWSIP